MTKPFANFAEWLLGAFQYLAILIINFGVDVINFAILSVASIFHLLLALFPETEMNLDPPPELVAMAGHINWFIPMSSVAGAISLVCATYVLYFTIRPVLKFLQLA